MADLNGKVAVVTGASRGVGRGIAIALVNVLGVAGRDDRFAGQLVQRHTSELRSRSESYLCAELCDMSLGVAFLDFGCVQAINNFNRRRIVQGHAALARGRGSHGGRWLDRQCPGNRADPTGVARATGRNR